MAEPKNLIVAQSGGPSAVINNSLRGLVETARDLPEIGTIYAGWHGIEGVLKEELLDLTAQQPQEIALLRTTPAAGSIGTCRYKLLADQQEDFDRIIEIFKAHNIGYFCYIGGNDSMDTANKVAMMAQERGLDVTGIGVPKTIDNDVGDSEFKLIDHTPGYGSTARYWAHMVQLANEENCGSSPADPVLVLQAMGRKIGYIPAAARLADPNRELPLQIYLAERETTLDEMADKINDCLKAHGRAIVVISEGLKLGDIGEKKDSFGHTQFSSSEITAAQIVVNGLNKKGLAVKGSARGNVPEPINDTTWHLPLRLILMKPTPQGKRQHYWQQQVKAGLCPPYCVMRGLSIMSTTTKFHCRKWQTANGHFRRNGSVSVAQMSPMSLSNTPGLSLATTG